MSGTTATYILAALSVVTTSALIVIGAVRRLRSRGEEAGTPEERDDEMAVARAAEKDDFAVWEAECSKASASRRQAGNEVSVTTYRFREVKRSAQRRLKCRSCGKRFSRSRTFFQTINPWNLNAAGDPKTYAEIWKELGVEAGAWQPDDLCTRCGDQS